MNEMDRNIGKSGITIKEKKFFNKSLLSKNGFLIFAVVKMRANYSA